MFVVRGRLVRHARQLLQDHKEVLCIRVLTTIKGMMARDIDFGEKVSYNVQTKTGTLTLKQLSKTIYSVYLNK